MDILLWVGIVIAGIGLLAYIAGIITDEPAIGLPGMLFIVVGLAIVVFTPTSYEEEIEYFQNLGLEEVSVDGDDIEFTIDGEQCAAEFEKVDDDYWILGPTLLCTPGANTGELPILETNVLD